ncbi:hypothetical protein [Microbaculum marinum]|uniref:Uncharacterized protein n=1 Tax=Microbaculum marinum TaxID=1764581 RepID=A0AAW9RI59_9HYPH
MSHGKFDTPAELYSSRNHRAGRFSGLKYRRFETLAEAVKYAVEEIPGQLHFAWIETGDSSFRAAEIRDIYGSTEFPLPRA